LANRFGIHGRVVELYVRFVDASGEPTNADAIPKVEILDPTYTTVQANTNIGVTLVDDPGLYKFTYNIPLTGPDGYYIDRWTAKIGNVTVTNDFAFLVTSAGDIEEDLVPNFQPGDDIPWAFNKDEVYGINVLLKFLKARLKNDGVRKVPDGAGGYTESQCNVFSNAELICFLVNGLSGFNQYPHFTQFKFSDPQIYTLFADIVVQGGVLLALAAQALIERGREFSINDNGVTYQPPQISEILNSQYSAQLADYKEKLKMIKSSLKPAPISVGTFRVTSISPAYLRLRHLRQRQII
jgi:hypothetical protein